MDAGHKYTTRLLVIALVSIYQVPFWEPVLDLPGFHFGNLLLTHTHVAVAWQWELTLSIQKHGPPL